MKRKVTKGNSRGITLIALVITIIILIILAGVSINLVLGENGIITKARGARLAQEKADIKEKIQLEIAAKEAEKLANLNGITQSEIEEILVKYGTVNYEDDGTIKSLKPTGKDYEIPFEWNSTETDRTLAGQITSVDYGKTINYSVTVKNTSNEDVILSDWKVFYNDGKNVYIILSDYLENTLIPTSTGIATARTYLAYWKSDSVLAEPKNKSQVEVLTSADNWNTFATGKGGQSATGCPTLEMYVASWNAKGYTKLYTATNDVGYYIGTSENPTTYTVEMSSDTAGYADALYYPQLASFDRCNGYKLASPSARNSHSLMEVVFNGEVGYYYTVVGDGSMSLYTAVRPVVCLEAGITGTVGETVSID